jgi:hypothetical protein
MAFQFFKIARVDYSAKAESGKRKAEKTSRFPLSAFRFGYPTNCPFWKIAEP